METNVVFLWVGILEHWSWMQINVMKQQAIRTFLINDAVKRAWIDCDENSLEDAKTTLLILCSHFTFMFKFGNYKPHSGAFNTVPFKNRKKLMLWFKELCRREALFWLCNSLLSSWLELRPECCYCYIKRNIGACTSHTQPLTLRWSFISTFLLALYDLFDFLALSHTPFLFRLLLCF